MTLDIAWHHVYSPVYPAACCKICSRHHVFKLFKHGSCTAPLHLQVGSTTWFDLVDYDRLAPAATFRVRKLMRFSELKQQVCGLHVHVSSLSI
jgi:hypothetical protein